MNKEKEKNVELKTLVFPYRCTVKVEFYEAYPEKKVKELYKEFLSISELDGFSEINTVDDDTHTTFFVLTAKDNSKRLDLTNTGFEVTFTNTFDAVFRTQELDKRGVQDFLEILKSKSVNIFSDISSMRLMRESAIFSTTQPQDIAKKIFSKSFVTNAYGYTAQYMSHLEDLSLKSEHVHSFTAIHNAYINEVSEEPLSGIVEGLNPYIISIEFTYDSHEDSVLEDEDVGMFVDKYLDKSSEVLETTGSSLGLISMDQASGEKKA